MTSTIWNNELELEFLEHYQREPVLWNAKHKYYKDKNQNNDAWFRISAFMGIAVVELKKKRDSLLSSYRKYRKMVRDSIHSGAGASEVYKPIWFAFELMDSFLGEGYKCNQTINTIIAHEAERQLSSQLAQGEEEIEIEIVPTPQASNTSQKELPTKRRRANPPELQEAGVMLKQAIGKFDAALVRKDVHEDIYDLYGKLLAGKLRKLPEAQSLRLMYEIDGMFLRDHSLISLQSSYIAPPTPSPTTSYSSYGSSFNRPESAVSCHSHGSTLHMNTERYEELSTEVRDVQPLIIVHSNDVIKRK